MRKFPFLFALLLVGCFDGDGKSTAPAPSPVQESSPEITGFTVMSGTLLYMEGDGVAVVTARLFYKDEDLDIRTMRVQVTGSDSQSISIGPINSASGMLSEEFSVSTTVLGTFAVDIQLIDAAGNESNSLRSSVRVQSRSPEIAALDPAEVQVGGGGFDLAVTGSDFMPGATVTWDGADRTTTYVSGAQLIASIPPSDLQTPRLVSIHVRNPDPTAGASNALTFAIAAAGSVEPDGFPMLITKTIDGLPPNGPIVNGGLDWDGGFVTFASKASNLVLGDTNDAYDLFIRDTCMRYIPDPDCTVAMTRAVMGIGGTEPNGDIGWTETSPDDSLAVSFNGRYVAFVSSADNLVPDDTNGVDDVFLVDICTESYPNRACVPGVVRVSLGNDGAQSMAPASYPAVADDGRYVLFVSADPNLVAGDTNGAADVFMRDTCRGGGEGCTPSTVRVSVTNAGGQANGASGEPAFTGRYVAFTSLASNLVQGDSNGLQDVFIHDTCIGQLACTPSTRLVSIGRLDDPADGASSDPQVSYPMESMSGHDYHGRFVAFVSSATNLVPGDENGAQDVFRRDTCTNEPGCTPSTDLVSVTSTGTQVTGDSWSPDFMAWWGGNIPFVTAADGVVPGDTNGLADVYERSDTTERISLGAGGAQTDGASYAPRFSNHFYGPWLVTYVSEASNILPDAEVIPNNGNIYMDRNY